MLIHDAHAHGLMVLLDLVYNHFCPDGNYLGLHAAQFFAALKRTSRGDATNFGEAEARHFFLENAIYWLNAFRFDGLRLDAVHASTTERLSATTTVAWIEPL